jgi:hypothetical protein
MDDAFFSLITELTDACRGIADVEQRTKVAMRKAKKHKTALGTVFGETLKFKAAVLSSMVETIDQEEAQTLARSHRNLYKLGITRRPEDLEEGKMYPLLTWWRES